MEKFKIGDKVKFTYKGFDYTGVIVSHTGILYRCKVEECLSCSNDDNTTLLTDCAETVYWYGWEEEFELIKTEIQEQNVSFLKKLIKIIKST